MSIYTILPEHARAMVDHVNVKIPVKDWGISISCNNSCGAAANLSRSDIRVFDKEDKDHTGKVFGSNSYDCVPATAGNLFKALVYIVGKLVLEPKIC